MASEQQGQIQARFESSENWGGNWDEIETVTHDGWLSAVDARDDLIATINAIGAHLPRVEITVDAYDLTFPVAAVFLNALGWPSS